MGGSSTKNSYTYYLGLSAEQHVQALEIWNKIKDDTPTHNKKILTRFFESFPNYKRYFIAVFKCEPATITENARVITHWQTVLDLIGFITMAVNTRRREIDNRLLYIALMHKDLGLTINDFSKYTTILIAYLNQEVAYLSPTMENHWTTLMNSIFQNINDKIDRMKALEMKSDAQGHEICITPELLGLSVPSSNNSQFFGLCKPREKNSFPLAVPNSFNYRNKSFWRDRKEYWNQQLYWFFKDSSVETSECTLSSLMSFSGTYEKKSKSISSLLPSTSCVSNSMPDQVYIIDSTILKKPVEDSFIIPSSDVNFSVEQQALSSNESQFNQHDSLAEISPRKPTMSDDLIQKPFRLPSKKFIPSQSETSNSLLSSKERPVHQHTKRRTNTTPPTNEDHKMEMDENDEEDIMTEASIYQQSREFSADNLSATFILTPQLGSNCADISKKELASQVNSAMSSLIRLSDPKNVLGSGVKESEIPDFYQTRDNTKSELVMAAQKVEVKHSTDVPDNVEENPMTDSKRRPSVARQRRREKRLSEANSQPQM